MTATRRILSSIFQALQIALRVKESVLFRLHLSLALLHVAVAAAVVVVFISLFVCRALIFLLLLLQLQLVCAAPEVRQRVVREHKPRLHRHVDGSAFVALPNAAAARAN